MTELWLTHRNQSSSKEAIWGRGGEMEGGGRGEGTLWVMQEMWQNT